MRKLFILIMFCCAFIVGAQETKDVVKFLNIPVDGSKADMIKKLQEKGFKYDKVNDYMTGEFNDKNVRLSIVTNNNKVQRIAVIDHKGTDEGQIKVRFNLLCDQFTKNDKYIGDSDSIEIPEKDDIGYNITVNNKSYEAVFYQKPDEELLKKEFSTLIYSKYTKAELENMPDEEKEKVEEEFSKMGATLFFKRASNKPVWFTIKQSYGEYFIVIYYDNEYNKSNGSDL